jgi:hypothetical protein
MVAHKDVERGLTPMLCGPHRLTACQPPSDSPEHFDPHPLPPAPPLQTRKENNEVEFHELMVAGNAPKADIPMYQADNDNPQFGTANEVRPTAIPPAEFGYPAMIRFVHPLSSLHRPPNQKSTTSPLLPPP